jgi:sulfur carrier protein ThiS
MKIHIHPSLIRFTRNNNKQIHYTLKSIKTVFATLFIEHPQLKAALMQADKLSPYINIYLNGEVISDIYAETSVYDEDEIEIMTALVGG